jgi:hypothetical protein
VSKVTAFREERHLGPGATTQKARQRFPAEVAALEDQVAVTVIACRCLLAASKICRETASSDALPTDGQFATESEESPSGRASTRTVRARL